MQHPVLPSLGNAETDKEAISVVLLTGVHRLALDATSFSLADSCPSVCCVTYDFTTDDTAETGFSMTRTIRRPGGLGQLSEGDCTTFSMEACCPTCSVKRDLVAALGHLCNRADMFLITLPIGIEGAPVAQYLLECSLLGGTARPVDAATIASVTDPEGFASRLCDDEQLLLAGTDEHDGVFDPRCVGTVQARLISEAEHVLLLPTTRLSHPDTKAVALERDHERPSRSHDLIAALASPETVIHPNAHAVSLHTLLETTPAATIPESADACGRGNGLV